MIDAVWNYFAANPVIWGVIIGSTISTVSGWLFAWAGRKHSEREHIRSLAIQLAIEEYRREGVAESFMAETNRDGKMPYHFDSGGLDAKVARMLAFAHSLSGKK